MAAERRLLCGLEDQGFCSFSQGAEREKMRLHEKLLIGRMVSSGLLLLAALGPSTRG